MHACAYRHATQINLRAATTNCSTGPNTLINQPNRESILLQAMVSPYIARATPSHPRHEHVTELLAPFAAARLALACLRSPALYPRAILPVWHRESYHLPEKKTFLIHLSTSVYMFCIVGSKHLFCMGSTGSKRWREVT